MYTNVKRVDLSDTKPNDKPCVSLVDALLVRRIKILSVTYKEAAIDVREKLSIGAESLQIVLMALLDQAEISEAVVINTCNRVELVVSSCGDRYTDEAVFNSMLKVLATVSSIPEQAINSMARKYIGRDAVNHLCCTSAGLDSMVFGEPQILGQVKNAYYQSHKIGGTKELLNALFPRVFSVAKLVRTQTDIGHHAVSLCYAVREIVHYIFDDIQTMSVMLIGTGEMGLLAAKYLHEIGVKRLFVVSSSLDRAVEVSRNYGAIPLIVEQCIEFLHEVDIIIGARAVAPTASPYVQKKQAQLIAQKRKCAPQLYVDLGVPRNFDSQLAGLPDVFLYTIDDLQSIVRDNKETRKESECAARELIEREVSRTCTYIEHRYIEHRRAVPVINDVHAHFENIRESEILRAMKRVKQLHLDVASIDCIEGIMQLFSKRLVSKFLHKPINSIKQECLNDESGATRIKNTLM